jgi:phage terminase large subunit
MEGITTFWGDEAQAFSQSSIDTLVPTIRKPGSRLIWTWNPDLETDPVDVPCSGAAISMTEDEAGDLQAAAATASFARSTTATIRGFPTCSGRRWSTTAARDFDKFLHVWQGSIAATPKRACSRTGAWRSSTAPTNAEYRLGADFGYSIDPSCAVRCYIDGRQIFVDYEAWGLQVEIVNLPALFMSIPDAEKYWMTADSSRPETISHLRKNGFPRIAPALKGARSGRGGHRVPEELRPDRPPRCKHLIDELTHYSYKVDSLTGR